MPMLSPALIGSRSKPNYVEEHHPERVMMDLNSPDCLNVSIHDDEPSPSATGKCNDVESRRRFPASKSANLASMFHSGSSSSVSNNNNKSNSKNKNNNDKMVTELQAQVQSLQRQLALSQAENDAKDKIITSLNEQLQHRQEQSLSSSGFKDVDAKLSAFFRNKFCKHCTSKASDYCDNEDEDEDDAFDGFDDDSESVMGTSTNSFTTTSSFCHAQRSSPSPSSSVQQPLDWIQQWFLEEGGNFYNVQSLLNEYCKVCRQKDQDGNSGLPRLDRLHVTTLLSMNPHLPQQQDLSAAHVWKWEDGQDFEDYQVTDTTEFLEQDVTFSVLKEGSAMEYRIQASSSSSVVPSGYEWFLQGDYQDHVVLPIYHGEKFVGTIAWSTKRRSGFSQQDVDLFHRSLKGLSTLLRLHTNEMVVMTLQERWEDSLQSQIRDLERANRRLASSSEKVLKRSQAQLKHFAMMSHEIRTPLNCIVGLSNLLLSEHQNNSGQKVMMDTQEVRESLEMITESGDLLLAVVDDVLDYSKLASGNVEIEIKPTNIRKTIRPVVESIRLRAASLVATDSPNGLQLRTFIADDLPDSVDMDGRRLQQILYNLLGNAIKFGIKGEFVDFSVTVAHKEEIETHLVSNDDDRVALSSHSTHEATPSGSEEPSSYILFSIKDYGKGIAEQDMEKIFQPFQQSKSNEAAHGGTGLGLAITSQLCKVLGGKISVSSEYGKWSEFVVKLPLVVSGYNDNLKVMDSQGSGAAMVANKIDRRMAFRNMGRASSRKLTAPLFSVLGQNSNDFHVLSPIPPTPPQVKRSKSDITSTHRSHVTSPPLTRVHDTEKVQPPIAQHPVSLPFSSSQSNETVRILIAEDNRVNQKVLVRTLQCLGIDKIDVVENGQEAVDKSAEKDYDLIFMDWQMPVLDGLESTKRIVARREKDPQAHHPRIVFLTAHALDNYREEASQAGGDGFISKPFKTIAIRRLLEQFHLMEDSQQSASMVNFAREALSVAHSHNSSILSKK
mmetsp:Transcript_18434/g.34303  ORF Transcript_18434/g.34303 Transcript_18434/m.34303 type:complete len:1003 (+) Transcript_18434:131-3139(+)